MEESPAWDAVITPCGSGVTVSVICHNWGFSWQSILHLHISYYKIYISKEDSGINNNNKNVFEAREQFLAWLVGGGGGGTPLSSLLEREWGGERKRVFMYLFKNSCTYLCKISLKLWGSSELWHKNKSIDANQKIFMEFGWLFVAVVQASPL